MIESKVSRGHEVDLARLYVHASVPTDYAYFKTKLRPAGAKDEVLNRVESDQFTQANSTALLGQKLLN